MRQSKGLQFTLSLSGLPRESDKAELAVIGFTHEEALSAPLHLRQDALILDGESDLPEFSPGARFTLADHDVGEFNRGRHGRGRCQGRQASGPRLSLEVMDAGGSFNS